MAKAYSPVGIIDEVKNTSWRAEDLAIRIALQTIECGIFILHYTSDAGQPFVVSPASNLFISHQITPTRPANNWGHAENTFAPLGSIFAAQGGA